MERTKRLLLCFGLCLVFYHVHAGSVRILGSSPYNTDEEMSGKLTELQKRKADLEGQIAKAGSPVERWHLQMDLRAVESQIAQWEPSLRVPYTDYVASLSDQREEFELEKAHLRLKLVKAENKRLQAVDALALHEQNKNADLDTYKAAFIRATNERNMNANEYAKFTEAYYQQEEKMKQQRDHFLTEKEKLQQTLDAAKKKHSEVLQALAGAPTEGYNTIRIPEQGEINKLREDITKFNGMVGRKKLKEGLETTRTKLVELLGKLHKAGKFSSNASFEDIERVLGEVETNNRLDRQDLEIQRKILVEKLKKDDLRNYESEIASLKRVNEEIAAVDFRQKELARSHAYLKGIVEVSDLIKECLNAIRDANERNLANMWAEAIQEAADSPLGKQWAKSMQEARDSDVAKGWAHAIQDAKNSKLAKAWTNAVEEAKDIKLEEAWEDAVQNLKNSPVVKMWSNTVKNAKDSPFTKGCANTVQGAKNSFSEVFAKLNKNRG